MDSNGEINKLVHSFNSEETDDGVVSGLFSRFIDQPKGIQNKLLGLATEHFQYYGKRDLISIFKQCKNGGIKKLLEAGEEEDIKPYIVIGDEVIQAFHIITLKTMGINPKPIMMVFKNYSYRTDLSNVESFISNRIIEQNLSHKYTFNEVIHYISKQTLFNPEKLNYDDMVIIFQNGVYDFRLNKFIQDKEPWRWHYFCEIPHDYRKGKADCPKFKKAVVQWIDKKTDKWYRKGKRTVLMNDIFEFIGLCMTMNMGFRTSFMLHGPPRCGKSQFFNIICYIIGKANRSNTSLQRLGKNEFRAEGLEFKLLNYCGDLPSSKIMDTGLFKSIVGGDIGVESEKKGGSKHEIRPVCKFCLNANIIPKLGQWDDTATYDRIVIIPFENQFEMLDDDTIENFYNHIINSSEEIQGIIHEAIKGFKRLIKRGSFRSILKEKTQHTWNYSSNKCYAFKFDYCKVSPKGRIQVDEFQDMFTSVFPGISKNYITRGLYEFGIVKKEGRIKGTDDKKYFYYGIDWKDGVKEKKEGNESGGLLDDYYK